MRPSTLRRRLFHPANALSPRRYTIFLGIDIGTGGTRAVIVSRAGTVLAPYSADHAPISSLQPGWAEQDPEDWWRATQIAVRAVLAALTSAQIESIGLTGQMHGCVLLDANGEVLRPALIWCDQRTQPQCDWLNQTLGPARLISLVANPALPNFTLAKMLWVKQHQPELWARVAHVLCPKDFIRFRLTNTYAMDMQEASGTLLLDVAHRRWSSEVAAAAGIPLTRLPQLFESPEICAHISPAGAAATGLPARTPVVAGAGDQGAGAVGMGVLTPGMVSSTIGTSGVVFAATATPTLDPLGRLHTFAHAAPNTWHVMGVTNAAGLSMRWLRDTLMPDLTYEEMTTLAATVPPGADGVLWAPYLFGERTPHLDPLARAAFTGITASTTRGHFVRAVMEGVAFSLRDTLTLFAELSIPVTQIRLGGGGARSPLWRQIQADTFAQPVELLQAEEGAAFGAALLAGVGIAAWPDVPTACAQTIRVAETIHPQNAAAMDAAYTQYRKLYPALKQLQETPA